jgi:sugar lactone lactonase YvrE
MRKRTLVIAAVLAAGLVAGALAARPRAVALKLDWPTSVAVKPSGFLLLVENGNRTVKRVNPFSGKTTVIARAARAYSVARVPSGATYLSAANLLLRLDGHGGTTQVAQAYGDIGPIAVASNGDVYFTTDTEVWKVSGGAGPATLVASGLLHPHGLAVTSDGGLLVSDTGHGQVERIDLGTGLSQPWGQITEPGGIAIASDGTTYIVDVSTHHVVHLLADGRPIGTLKHRFTDPYAVAVSANGTVYVVDTAAWPDGRLYRIGPSGKTTVIAQPLR